MSQVLGVEIEQAIAGMVLNSPLALEEAMAALSDSDFTSTEPKFIFRAAADISEKGGTVDPLTVAEWIRVRNGKDLTSYIGAVVQSAPEAEAAADYMSMLKNRTAERKLLLFREAANGVVEKTGPVEERVAQLLSELEKITSVSSKESTRTIGQIFEATIEDLTQSAAGIKRGLSTGFKSLDEKIGGLEGGDLVIIAGRPSMGKTSFAMNIAENVGLEGGRSMVFSMEMPSKQLAMRTISGRGEVDLKRMRTGTLTNVDLERIDKAMGMFQEDALLLNDISGLTLAELRLHALKAHRKYGKLSLILIDYIQLMEGKGDGRNRNQEITEISRGLKALAKELDCPVIALSQLSRDCEKRADKRPMNSDLRESGAIEQDADIIMFVYRDEMYNPNSRFKGKSEIIIGKQRNGPIGIVELDFDKQFSSFRDSQNASNPFRQEEEWKAEEEESASFEL